MATIELPPDLSEFLKLLHSHEVEYLLVGGYAVGLHGYPRATGDLDIWVRPSTENAEKLARVFVEFGYSPQTIQPDIFLDPNRVIRMGVPPICIDVIMTASGADFSSCYERRSDELVSGVPVKLISLDDLKINKKASGRPKDIDDLQNLA
jgi:hypothetical protein